MRINDARNVTRGERGKNTILPVSFLHTNKTKKELEVGRRRRRFKFTFNGILTMAFSYGRMGLLLKGV